MHTWADDFRTYGDVCIYYGVDTPAQVAAEMAYYDQLAHIETQDDLEAWGGAAARSHAAGSAHRDWMAANGLGEPREDDLIRLVLWGRTEAAALPADPALGHDPIPF
jgi:hypothetical protein